jgi:hypothetical protein
MFPAFLLDVLNHSSIGPASRAPPLPCTEIFLLGSSCTFCTIGTIHLSLVIDSLSFSLFVQRSDALFADPKMPIDIEPRAYTTKEFINRAHQGGFALESVENRITFYGKRFFERIREPLRRPLGR